MHSCDARQHWLVQSPSLKVWVAPWISGIAGDKTFILVEREGQRVVGAHMVGKDAVEIIQGIAIGAGVTKAQFEAMLGIHPTAAEEFVTLRG